MHGRDIRDQDREQSFVQSLLTCCSQGQEGRGKFPVLGKGERLPGGEHLHADVIGSGLVVLVYVSGHGV
jgi:hypothetical protein